MNFCTKSLFSGIFFRKKFPLPTPSLFIQTVPLPEGLFLPPTLSHFFVFPSLRFFRWPRVKLGISFYYCRVFCVHRQVANQLGADVCRGCGAAVLPSQRELHSAYCLGRSIAKREDRREEEATATTLLPEESHRHQARRKRRNTVSAHCFGGRAEWTEEEAKEEEEEEEETAAADPPENHHQIIRRRRKSTVISGISPAELARIMRARVAVKRLQLGREGGGGGGGLGRRRRRLSSVWSGEMRFAASVSVDVRVDGEESDFEEGKSR